MKSLLAVLILAAVIAGFGTAPRLLAYPTPAMVSHSWNLEFSHDVPRAIAVKSVDGLTRWYWYMTYKVVNKTGEDRLFVPEITIATDEGDIVSAGRGVASNVYDAIKEQAGNRFLESPARVVGKILQGQDYAKESVAIWPVFAHDVTQVTVFVGGLSGETQVITIPGTDKSALVSKTLMMTYKMPGDPASPQNQAVMAQGEDWIMR
ncbi:MAG: hypothetical protein WD042_07480 [Phycisphaeraceae bacterium]